MNLKNLIKYFVRFLFLQLFISFSTIWYFDNFVFLGPDHKFEIYLNLVEDRERFYNFIPVSWVTIDGLIFINSLLYKVLHLCK